MKVITQTLADYITSVGLLLKPRYLKYVFITGLISLVFYSLMFYLATLFGGWVGGIVDNRLADNRFFDSLVFLSKYGSIIAIVAVLALFFKHIVLVLSGPVMGPLSEAIESERRGHKVTTKFDAAYSLLRGVRIALRNVSKELGMTLVLVVIGLIIPPLAVVTTPLIFLIQAYYTGFGSLDFYCERRYDYKEAVQFVRKRRLLATANGAVFLALFFIPVIGAFIATSMSTSAATLSLLREESV